MPSAREGPPHPPGPPPSVTGRRPFHSHTLPDDPVYAFCPAYDFDNMPQQIRIVFDSMPGYVPTALVALSLEDALRICDRLNARIGLDRDAWSAIAARAMSATRDEATH